MKRTFDAYDINKIANHPAVFPNVGFTAGTILGDLSPIVQNAANFALISDCKRGVYILQKVNPGLYVAHTMSVPEARGGVMHKLMIDGFAFMYTETDAIEINTIVPDGNKQARSWAEIAGFRKAFTRKAVVPLCGQMVDATFMTQTYMDWVLRDRMNRTQGELFHRALNESGGHVDHAPDAAHDHWVGATIRTAKAGNLAKAATLYNRWASWAGYAQIKVISVNPPLVDIGGDIVSLSHDGLVFLIAQSPPPSPEGLKRLAESPLSCPLEPLSRQPDRPS